MDNTQTTQTLTQAQIQDKMNWAVTEPKSAGDYWQLAQILAKVPLLHPAYRGHPHTCFYAMLRGASLGFAPAQAVEYIIPIQDKLTMYGDALLAVCRRSDLCGGISETYDDDTATATCTAIRRGDPTPVVRTFSRADAEKAGLWNKPIWRSYPKRMLAMRARAFALRDAYADILHGIACWEEVQDYPDTPPYSTNGKSNVAQDYAVYTNLCGDAIPLTSDTAAKVFSGDRNALSDMADDARPGAAKGLYAANKALLSRPLSDWSDKGLGWEVMLHKTDLARMIKQAQDPKSLVTGDLVQTDSTAQTA